MLAKMKMLAFSCAWSLQELQAHQDAVIKQAEGVVELLRSKLA